MPSVADSFETLRRWLMAAGVARVRMGYYDPQESGAPACTEPIAGMMPGTGRHIPGLTPSGWEEMPVEVVIWSPQDGHGFFYTEKAPRSWGGFGRLMTIHDNLFAGPSAPVAATPTSPALQPTVGGMFPSRESSQLAALPDSWELWWFTGGAKRPVAASFSVMLRYRVGPTSIDPNARYNP